MLQGEIERADWWHFAGRCGETADELQALLLSAPSPDEPEREEAADALRRLATFIRGEYTAAPSWNGGSSSKSVFLLKQDFDGHMLSDKPLSQTEQRVIVEFVGGEAAFE